MNGWWQTQQDRAVLAADYAARLARWRVAYTARWVETRFGPTHVLVCGETARPAVVLFHGWGGNSAPADVMFDLPRWVQRFQVVLPDTIGQSGRSAASRPSTRNASYGDWLADVLDGLGIARAFLAGSSGGGYLALKFAAVHPARARGLAVLSPAGIVPVRVGLDTLAAMLPFGLWPGEKQARRVAVAMCARGASTAEIDAFAGLMRLYYRHGRPQVRGPAVLDAAALARITMPVLVRVGAEDPVWPRAALIARVRRWLPQVTVEVVAGARHEITTASVGRMMAFFEAFGGSGAEGGDLVEGFFGDGRDGGVIGGVAGHE